MSLGQQMKTRRQELGLSRAALAERLGLSPSAISNYENGISSPKEEVLLRLFDVLEVEPNYLFQDSFSARNGALSPAEVQLIERYRALSAKGKLAVGAVMDAAEEDRHSRVVSLPSPKSTRQIPLFASPAAAGYASPVLGEEYELIAADGAPERAQFAVRICGDSMEPQIADGSIVYVSREPLHNGDVGIFCVDGDMFCKQYYKDPLNMVYLFSLNRARADADIVLTPGSGRTLACFGRVLTTKRYPLPDGRGI